LFGNHWTAEQKKAYRAAFTMGRIVDELWILIAFIWSAVCVTMFDQIGWPLSAVVFVTGLGALGLASHRFLPTFVRTSMPRELSDALVDDRFAGASSPQAPRTYRELLSRWVRR
jgi:ABC-type uncharacterized transport system permease subunit